MRVRGSIVVCLVIMVTLSGCFGKKGKDDDGVIVDPNYTGNNTTEAPLIVVPEIPPCALQAGDIEWPVWPAATPPDGPVDVTIKRDKYGVPQIYADDLYSLMYGNGYAQAQDRLFEIDLLRHVGWGDSASVAGASQLASDFEVERELYSDDEINAQYDAAPDYAKSILQAYSDGVNRYIAEATARNELPGEFAALGHTPEPWTPQDSVASIDYLIGYFGVDGGGELGNLQRLATMSKNIGDDNATWNAFGDLAWLRIDDSYTSIPVQDKVVNGCEDPLPSMAAASVQTANMDAALDAKVFGGDPVGDVGLPGPLGPIPPTGAESRETKGRGLFDGFHWGSNAFLADASITDTGDPIMWGAPQMGYYKPPVPYQVGLHGAGFDAVGIGVASAPGIVIGRNNDIAWTATSGIEDMTDIVELQIAKSSGGYTYKWDGQDKAMDCYTVTHGTAPAPADMAAFPDVAPPMTYEQQVCRAGDMNVVAVNEDAGVAWAKRWTTKNQELLGAFIWLGLAKSTSAAEFKDNVADFPFTFNFHVADMDDVYYIHTGDIPLRADGYDYRLPTPAGSAYEWTGQVYTDGMGTWIKNPSTGYIANWNNGPAYGWRAGDVPGLWGPVHRVQSEDRAIQEALADGQITFDEVAAANWRAATQDSLAMPFMPFLIQAAQDAGQPDVVAALESWRDAGLPWRDDDGDAAYDDPAHAVWDRMYARLLAMQQDELGDYNHELDLDPRTAGDPHAGDHGDHHNWLTTILKALQGNAAYGWCSAASADAPGGDAGADVCREQLASAMTDVVADLKAAYGDDVNGWNEPLHYSGFTAMGAFNADERPMVNRGSWVQVVAMGQGVAKAKSALPPSNIGRINGPETAQWVADGSEPDRLTLELDMYWRGEGKPFPLTAAEVDAVVATTETLTIVPAPPVP